MLYDLLFHLDENLRFRNCFFPFILSVIISMFCKTKIKRLYFAVHHRCRRRRSRSHCSRYIEKKGLHLQMQTVRFLFLSLFLSLKRNKEAILCISIFIAVGDMSVMVLTASNNANMNLGWKEEKTTRKFKNCWLSSGQIEQFSKTQTPEVVI